MEENLREKEYFKSILEMSCAFLAGTAHGSVVMLPGPLYSGVWKALLPIRVLLQAWLGEGIEEFTECCESELREVCSCGFVVLWPYR